MTTLVLHEVARWVRAVGAPLAVLTIVVVTPSLMPDAVGEILRLPSNRALSVAWMATVVATLAWVLTVGVRAALQPACDRRAAQHLQDLRVRAGLRDHALFCILRVLWSTPAGEHVGAVDVHTGATLDLWLAESELPPGSYALVRFRGGAGVVVGTALPGVVLAARRQARRSGTARRPTGTRGRDRRAAARVIRTAEALLR